MDVDKNIDYIQTIYQEKMDGIIIMNGDEDSPGFMDLIQSNLPMVAIGTYKNDNIYQVDINNNKSTQNIIQYLFDLGHKKIGFISHSSIEEGAGRSRFEGYLEALKNKSILIKNEWIKTAEYTEESGIEAMENIIEGKELPTAFFCSNDQVAIGGMKALLREGLKVPEDISIVGFDDDPLSQYINPPLTTVAQPTREIGETVINLILEQLEGMKKPRRIILETEIKKRGSCRKFTR
jgi:LacI family transcriptional regulator